MYPLCGSVVERKSHVTRRSEPERKNILHISVGELVDWVYETTDDYGMATFLSKYMVSQGELTFKEAGYEPSSASKDSCD